MTPLPSGSRVLRVVSGPSAGAEVAIGPDAPVAVGHGASCELLLDDTDVSRRHAQLRIVGDKVEVADLGSSNGTWVDGRRLTEPFALVDGQLVQLGASRLIVETRGQTMAVLTRSETGTFLVNRRYPDRRKPFDPPTVQLPAAPPPDDDARQFPVLSMILALVVAVVLALVLRQPTYLMIGLLSPIMYAGNWWSERRHRQRREQRREGSYAGKLTAATVRVEAAADEEDADLRRRWPDPETVLRIAGTPRVELWARRPGAEDWLGVRLGAADRPASVVITGDQPADWEHLVLRRAPVGIGLDTHGVLELAGPSGWLRRRIDWVIVATAVLHSPDELRIAVLAPGANEADLGWLRWLPHLRTNDGAVLAVWDVPSTDALVRSLGDELDRRAVASGPAGDRTVGSRH